MANQGGLVDGRLALGAKRFGGRHPVTISQDATQVVAPARSPSSTSTVDAYVDVHLEIAPGRKTFVADILCDFRDKTGASCRSLSDAKFWPALESAIRRRDPAWESVHKYNGRLAGRKGMLYENIARKNG